LIYPTRETALSLSKKCRLIPLCKRVLADTETPIRLYARVKDQPNSFLLESVEESEHRSRYSFIGYDPFLTVKGKGTEITTTKRNGESETTVTSSPFDFLKSMLEQYKTPVYKDFPSFLGGAVGYTGYDAVRFIEPDRKVTKGTSDQNDLHYLFVDRLLVFDHLKDEVIFVSHLKVFPGMSAQEIKEAYDQEADRLEKWSSEFLKKPGPVPSLSFEEREVSELDIKPDVSKDEFMQMVKQTKEYIQNGEVLQVVLARSLTVETAPPPFDVYRALRVLNPSPYMYYLNLGDEKVVGTSPEVLVRVTGSTAETCPIAGTRPRGKDEQEDQELMDDLLQDQKERDEHVMLVDLGREDIGRVAKVGTVKVPDYMKIEKYSHVMHLVSRIQGELKEGKKPMDALIACFPAGTLSGAPRVRAMEIIADLEASPRGIYGGALGYFSFSGDMDQCITIRTIVFRDGKAQVQSGAGIVAASDPEREYFETLHKAKGMLKALAMVRPEKARSSVG
jgi:anthranilate synthase component I